MNHHKQLLLALEDQGWIITITGGSHYRATPPPGLLGRDGQRSCVVFLALTPSDHRSIKNARSLLRRQGADV